MRRWLPPFPLEGLAGHPAAAALPATPFGLLTRILFHYWRTGCRPLPAEGQLRSIAGAQPSVWRTWRREVMAIFGDLAPELERAYAARQVRRSVILDVAARGSAAAAAAAAVKRASKRAAENLRASPAALSTVVGTLALPRRSSEGARRRVNELQQRALDQGFVD